MTDRRCLAGFAWLAALALPVSAVAGVQVKLDSAVFVERISPAQGRLLEPARVLRRGDRLVYVVSWQRSGASDGFTVTNPLPRAVAYQKSAEGNEEVSVDGGHSWGKLEALRKDGHLATPEDVTHMRWRIPGAQAAQGSGRITYSAIVR